MDVTLRQWISKASIVMALLSASFAVWANPAAATDILADTFAERSQVSVAQLMAALEQQAQELQKSSVLRQEYQALMAKHGLQNDEQVYADYVRIKLAFESTRAGGLWGLAWTVTDQQPHSEKIWAQWQHSGANYQPKLATTAVGECDELSALMAFVAKRIGLSKRSQVGLFWPTSNHTVAVWTIAGARQLRIVIPTSQVMLDDAQSLGTTSFDPYQQKTIYEYRREDIKLTATLPASLANYFIRQTKQYAGLPQAELQLLRNQREKKQRE